VGNLGVECGSASVRGTGGSLAVAASTVYGPFSGWQVVGISAGSDGVLRLLWDNTNGAAALWILNNSGVFQAAGTYGPF
jgi:hypothetical protein